MLNAVRIELSQRKDQKRKMLLATMQGDPETQYGVTALQDEKLVNAYVVYSLLDALGYPVPKVCLFQIDEELLHLVSGESMGCRTFLGVEYPPEDQEKDFVCSTCNSFSDDKLTYELVFLKCILSKESASEQNPGTLDSFLQGWEILLLNELQYRMFVSGSNNHTHGLALLERKNYYVHELDFRMKQGELLCSSIHQDADAQMVQAARNKVLEKFGTLNLTGMRPCFQELRNTYGEELAGYYETLIKRIKESCKNLVEMDMADGQDRVPGKEKELEMVPEK